MSTQVAYGIAPDGARVVRAWGHVYRAYALEPGWRLIRDDRDGFRDEMSWADVISLIRGDQ